MKELLFDNGKDIVKFLVNGAEVKISVGSTNQIFIANAKTFEDAATNKRSLIELRRSKGEKFYQEWKKDMDKFKSFVSEEQVVDDIMEDFQKKRGWKLIE